MSVVPRMTAADVVTAGAVEGGPRAVLAALSDELLMVAPRRGHGVAGIPGPAAVTSDLAAELRAYYIPGERAMAEVLRAAAATSLLCLVDGLTAHLLIDRIDAATARAALADQLARLLPGLSRPGYRPSAPGH